MDKESYKLERELQKQRDRSEIMNQHVRSLTLINGGAAVALLAFIQAVFNQNDSTDIVKLGIVAAVIFSVGAGIAGANNYWRVLVSKYDGKPQTVWTRTIKVVSHFCSLAPVGLFIIGCLVFGYAAWRP